MLSIIVSAELSAFVWIMGEPGMGGWSLALSVASTRMLTVVPPYRLTAASPGVITISKPLVRTYAQQNWLCWDWSDQFDFCKWSRNGVMDGWIGSSCFLWWQSSQELRWWLQRNLHYRLGFYVLHSSIDPSCLS
jgi:hypothetical protein